MTQILCYTGQGFNTCWCTVNTANQHAVVVSKRTASVFTPIRFIK